MGATIESSLFQTYYVEVCALCSLTITERAHSLLDLPAEGFTAIFTSLITIVEILCGFTSLQEDARSCYIQASYSHRYSSSTLRRRFFSANPYPYTSPYAKSKFTIWRWTGSVSRILVVLTVSGRPSSLLIRNARRGIHLWMSFSHGIQRRYAGGALAVLLRLVWRGTASYRGGFAHSSFWFLPCC